MNRNVSMLALVAAAELFAAPALADTSDKKIAFPTTTPAIPGARRC
jgi:hypothetical protein